MHLNTRNILFSFVLAFFLIQTGYAAEKLFPFYLASKTQGGDVAAVVSDTKSKLSAAGFEIVGEYSPYSGAHIIVITNDELKSNAAASDKGGFGAIQRVSVTDVKGEVQVAYTNPIYMSHAYRMKGNLSAVEEKLKSTLGFMKAYGPDKGMSADDIRDYHYMFGMPYFDDPVEIADHGSYDNAIKAVEAGLAAGKGGVSKVYRVDVKGKKETVFGVKMTQGKSSDAFIMKEIDFKPVRSTAHLPYEMLVTADGKVYILAAEFRIAINFTDLSMAGSNSFMGIMASPDAIIEALRKAAGG